MTSPAERYLNESQSYNASDTGVTSTITTVHANGRIVCKVLAVVVFIVLILIGTYFARISGPALLGYIIGAAAFIIAPWIWNSRRT